MSLVGQIHVTQRDPPFLTRCIQDDDVAFVGLLLKEKSATRVTYDAEDRAYFYELPPWVSMARSWDDLDRFLGRTMTRL